MLDSCAAYGLPSPCIRPLMAAVQMLDRYVQDSADNAQASSESGSQGSDEEDSMQSSTLSQSGPDSEVEQQSTAEQRQADSADASRHLARLALNREQSIQNSADFAGLQHSDQQQELDQHTDVGGHSPTADSPVQDDIDRKAGVDGFAASDVSEDLPEDLLEDLPDHVAVRRKQTGDTAELPSSEAAQNLEECSAMSHASQIPSQEAVKQRVVDQHRSRMRRQVLARASRNAQKVGNKRERKQAASSVNW